MDIKELYRKGLNISEIARITGRDRKTIRKLAKQNRPPQPAKRERESKLDPYKNYILQRLSEGCCNAALIYEEITEKGFTGKDRIVRAFIQPYRPLVAGQATIRFETPPGKQAQVDWCKLGYIVIDGIRKPLYCFIMVLGYSRALYIEFTTSMDQSIFLRCHIHAFLFFGGVPQEILYDRLKTAVKSSDEQGKPVWNERFLDFAGYYGFTPRACRAYWPRTKGKVERPVRYIKEHFFAGVNFNSLEDLNHKAKEWLDTKANLRVHGTTRAIPAKRLREEQPYLVSLNGRPSYDTSLLKQRRVSRDCYVTLDTNRYSVPWAYVGRDVLVRVTAEKQVQILWQGELLAKHILCPGRYQVQHNPEHFRGLKPGQPQRLVLVKSPTRRDHPVVETRPCSYYEELVLGVAAHA